MIEFTKEFIWVNPYTQEEIYVDMCDGREYLYTGWCETEEDAVGALKRFMRLYDMSYLIAELKVHYRFKEV